MLASDPLLTPVRLRLEALREGPAPVSPRARPPRRLRRQLQLTAGTALVRLGTRLLPAAAAAKARPC